MKHNNKNQQGGLTDIFINLIEKGIDRIVGLFLPKAGFNVFKPGEMSKRWDEIEKIRGNLAVIEADKLTDGILKKANISGTSMADRIRKTESIVDPGVYQGMWDAHKLRNSLVHDVDRVINFNEINLALLKIKKYLIELGAFKNDRKV